jgi:FAD:protein FMN transferase
MFALSNFTVSLLLSAPDTNMITLALQAMATRFELVLNGDSPSLRAAGEEALGEISRIESMLSLYKPTSEVANLNALAAEQPIRVSAGMFELLERAVALSRETNGAFDITIAPLVRCWGFMRGQGSIPSDADIQEARGNVGSHLIELNAAERAVRFTRAGVMLDFGAFGKGYAGSRFGLLHGGTSTVLGIGRNENNIPWRVAVTGALPKEEVLWTLDLVETSLSVSAVWGKSFASQGRTFGHILDARTGQPSDRAELAAVNVPSAADSDALSTALLVEGPAGFATLATTRPEARALVFAGGNIFKHNIDDLAATPH